MFRVTPVKGDPYVVNGSHILSLIVSGTTPINLADGSRWAPGEVVAVDVRTYLRSNKTARNCLKGWRPARVDFEHADFGLTVPPYILGAWLGDGSAKVTAITKPPCRMVDEWVAWGASLGCTASVDTFGGRCQTVRLVTPRGQPNPAQDALRELGLLGKKRIPHRYLTGSYETRMELLAGLLDSDGHHCRGCYDWISKSESMARDFAFLARSLGFSAYLSAQRKGIKSRGFSAIYWRCSVSGDTSRIPCRDKKADERRITKNHLVTGIQSVESLGQGDYYGFELDGDHLYLLEDFTVCHNTELATAMLAATAENGKRGAFLADRRALVEQTIQRFDKYGLEAGVIMADHHQFAPSRLIQVCSVQTLLRRRWPDANLLFIDEAHVLSEAVRKKLEAKDCYAIGLSATPLTRGLGKYFDVVVNAPTTNRMIEMGRLVPVSIHSFKQPDMRAADVSSTGEWVGKKAEKEVLEVVGDVVQKYLEDGQGAKFVCFAWNIAHAVELSRQFLAAGINTATYTADDRPEDRHESVQEFKLPGSSIRGLISVAALSRGFDETSVSLMIDARPLRKAVHEYVQMMGRVMRAHPGKEVATVYDHSGNAVRFWEDWNNLFEFGVNKLDDGKPKPKQKTEPKQPEPVKCSQCGHLHRPQPFCPACFAAGSLVLTADGWLPIEEVRIGMLVLTHRGRWRPVVDTITREAKVLEVRGLGHPQLLTTADHPLLTRDGWEPAGQAKEWASPSFVERFPVSHVPYELTPALCRLIGCFIGDGYTSIKRRRPQPGQDECSLVITCGHTASETSRVAATIAEAGFKGTMRKVRTGHTFTVYSADLTRWLRAHFGIYSHGKRIPPWVMGLDAAAREALLAGYLEADGYHSPTGEWHASTVSKELAFSVKLLAQSLGYGCRLYREAAGTTTIEGRQYATREKWRLVGKPLSDTHGTHTRGKVIASVDGHHFAPIRERVEREAVEAVYDLTVDEDHSYVVEGIVVHNCGHEYPRRQAVQHVPGTLKELIAGKYHKELDKQLWPMVKGYVLERREGDAARKQALAIYKDMTGAFPNAYWESTTPVPPTLEVRNRIRSQQIRWARGREKAQAVAA